MSARQTSEFHTAIVFVISVSFLSVLKFTNAAIA
jgi:hypothetical protein